MSITKYLAEENYTNFAHVAQLSHFVDKLAANIVRMPRFVWQDLAGETLSFDGHPVSVAAYRQMYQKLLQKTKNILFEEVLLGLEIPDMLPESGHIYDDLSNTEPGYSFITDTRNKFFQHQKFLLNAMIHPETSVNRFILQSHSNSHGVMWNAGGVHRWEKSVERCLGCLFLLLHLGYGQPARGTELAVLRWFNSLLHVRNFFHTAGLLNVVTVYNKTQSISEKQRLINRCVPHEVGEFFVIWLALVVPTLVAVVKATSACDDNANRLYTYAFASRHALWDTDDFSQLLMSVTGLQVAEGGLGAPFGMAQMRHLLIAIMRRHVREQIDAFAHLVDEMLPEQSGHTAQTATRYGIDRDTILNTNVEEAFRQFQRLSQLFHQIILPSSQINTSTPTPTSSATGPSTLQQSHHLPLNSRDLELLASQLAPRMVPQMVAQLSAGVTGTIYDALATFIRQNSLGPSEAQIQNPGYRAASTAMATPLLAPSLSRYRELYALMKSTSILFKSKEQAAAVEHSARRTGDLLVVLPTGGGKGLIFELAAYNKEELAANMVTLVVVPLVALLYDIQKRLSKSGTSHGEWVDAHGWNARSDLPRIILVSADIASFASFMTFARELASATRLARLVIDEAHTLLTSASYRPILADLKVLRTLKTPVVFLTASLPPSAESELLKAYGCSPPLVTVVRAPTERRNLKYVFLPLQPNSSQLKFISKNGVASGVVTYINSLSAQLPEGERGIVFCHTRAAAEEMAGLLKCDFHHSSMPKSDRLRVVDAFTSPGGHQVIATTCGLGTGVNLKGVRWTVHWQGASSMLDQDQECGRAGRDDLPSQSIIFYEAGKAIRPPRDGQSTLGVGEQAAWLNADECRRFKRSEFMDGLGATCASLNALPCDYCEGQIQQTGDPVASRHPFLHYTLPNHNLSSA